MIKMGVSYKTLKQSLLENTQHKCNFVVFLYLFLIIPVCSILFSRQFCFDSTRWNCSVVRHRWWWPTLFLTRFRSCSVQKSKPWTSAWSSPRPFAASTTASPWLTCSATLQWTTEAASLLPSLSCKQVTELTQTGPSVQAVVLSAE